MVECLRHKPENPSHFLLKWLLQQNAGKGSEDVCVASAPVDPPPLAEQAGSKPEAGWEMHCALSHPNPQAQKWLREQRLPHIFLELMQRVSQDGQAFLLLGTEVACRLDCTGNKSTKSK